MDNRKVLLDAQNIDRVIERMVDELAEMVDAPDELAFIGIRTHGVTLARRMCRILADKRQWDVPVGSLDVTLYRDDLDQLDRQPIVRPTLIDFDITDRIVALVDDVIYTGRTVRCALAEIMDFGRPRAIRLVALVDRGLRELPIQPDIVGLAVRTAPEEKILVGLDEEGRADEVTLFPVGESPT